jgi:hypothetical protein
MRSGTGEVDMSQAGNSPEFDSGSVLVVDRSGRVLSYFGYGHIHGPGDGVKRHEVPDLIEEWKRIPESYRITVDNGPGITVIQRRGEIWHREDSAWFGCERPVRAVANRLVRPRVLGRN